MAKRKKNPSLADRQRARDVVSNTRPRKRPADQAEAAPVPAHVPAPATPPVAAAAPAEPMTPTEVSEPPVKTPNPHSGT